MFVSALFIALLGFNVNSVNAETICPNGNTLSSNCTVSNFAVIETTCPNGNTLASNCTSLSVGSTSTSTVAISQNLTTGSRGEDVKKLQQLLKELGILLGKIDGIYGPVTSKAVQGFQKDHSLTVTGKLDDQTLSKINLKLETICSTETDGLTGIYLCQKTKILPNKSNSPVISGVSGPQSLNVNQTGTWTVKASSSNGGNLSYSVDWGDRLYALESSTSPTTKTFQQSATFTHSYTGTGTYTPTFTVTSENTIYCIKAPCSPIYKSATTSLSVNVENETSVPSVTVLSPNGGETWISGMVQTIKWRDNNSTTVCPVGVYCTLIAPAPKYYDVKLVTYYPPCTSNVCPAVAYRAPYTIIKNVYGASYDWSVGKVLDSDDLLSGLYKIQVCETGTSVCDSSDSYFRINIEHFITN